MCLASHVLDIDVRQQKNCPPKLWYLVLWQQTGSPSPISDSWVCGEDMTGHTAQDLLRSFEQKYPEKVERANAEMKRRRGGRPPAPRASASTPACGGSAASASAASAPSLRLCSAVSSIVAGNMVQFLRRHPSFSFDDKETWAKFQELSGAKRGRDCSADTLLQHAQSDAFQKDLSHSKFNFELYEPENPKQKAYTR